MRFVSPLLQATGRGEGESAIRIKWLNPPECYVLSRWRMPSWFVLIREYKSIGNKAGNRERKKRRYTLECEMAWPHCWVTYFMLFSTLIAHWSLCSAVHTALWASCIYCKMRQASPRLTLCLGDPWTTIETDPLHIANDLPLLSWEIVIFRYHQTHYQTNHLWKWELTIPSTSPPAPWDSSSH